MMPFVHQSSSPVQSQSISSYPVYSKYSELLDQYCGDQGFGSPQYERSVVLFKDSYGRDTLHYNYKITIPALVNNYGSFQWTKLWQTDAEAREAAAQFVFLQLGVMV